MGPEGVGHAVGLDGEEALVVEEAVGEGGAGWVTVAGGAEVGDGGGEDGRGGGGEGVEEEVVEEGGEEGGGAELVAEVEGEGAGEGGVRDDGGVEIGSEGGFRFGVAAGFGLDLAPYPGLVVSAVVFSSRVAAVLRGGRRRR